MNPTGVIARSPVSANPHDPAKPIDPQEERSRPRECSFLSSVADNIDVLNTATFEAAEHVFHGAEMIVGSGGLVGGTALVSAGLRSSTTALGGTAGAGYDALLIGRAALTVSFEVATEAAIATPVAMGIYEGGLVTGSVIHAGLSYVSTHLLGQCR